MFKQRQRIPRPNAAGARPKVGTRRPTSRPPKRSAQTPTGLADYSWNGPFRSVGVPTLPPARSSGSSRREPDPFGFAARRDAAWTEWKTNPTAAQAFEFARLSGYCLLTGSGMPFLPLPVPVVALTGRQLNDHLLLWQSETRMELDAQGLAAVLEIRTDVWAVTEAIRRTEADLRDAGDRDALLVTRAFEPLFTLLDGFDAALEVHAEGVAEFARGDRAEALRGMLSPRFRTPLPWWLEDGEPAA